MFQPTPRFVSEANKTTTHGHDGHPVSTHAPLRQRGEHRLSRATFEQLLFQPTPRFVSEANWAARISRRPAPGFNPRPASSARRTVEPHLDRSRPTRFQPTPRFVSEANAAPHARPSQEVKMFQPTPRFVSEANLGSAAAVTSWDVSTHAPLRQRGEPCRALAASVPQGFNPRPASSARRTCGGSGKAKYYPFQPTPRFVSEANDAMPADDPTDGGFNPRPASSARRTGDPVGVTVVLGCFNPRPASSARRTASEVG